MVVLHSIVAAATLAGLASAVASVPQPSTGQAQLSAKLKRQAGKMEIVRRASQMRKRQNPSAVPEVRVLCGDVEAGQEFFLSSRDPLDDARFVYGSISYSDVVIIGTADITYDRDINTATPFVLDDLCRLNLGVGLQTVTGFVSPQTPYTTVMMGTDGGVAAAGGDILSCIGDAGEFRCGGSEQYLPGQSTNFCRSWMETDNEVFITAGDCSQWDAYSLPLAISPTPPAQPPPSCGDYPINVPFWVTAQASTTPEATVYGRAEDGNINGGGQSPLWINNAPTLATAFVFDDQCRVNRYTTQGTVGVRATYALQKNTIFGIPQFSTDAIIGQNTVDILTCTSAGRTLRCGTGPAGYIPIDYSTFCQWGTLRFGLATVASNPAAQNCFPTVLNIVDTQPTWD